MRLRGPLTAPVYTPAAISKMRVGSASGIALAREPLGNWQVRVIQSAPKIPCGDVIVFGAADPAFGLITPNNNVRVLQESVQVDMRGKRADNLMVSEDGTRIRFGLQSRG